MEKKSVERFQYKMLKSVGINVLYGSVAAPVHTGLHTAYMCRLPAKACKNKDRSWFVDAMEHADDFAIRNDKRVIPEYTDGMFQITPNTILCQLSSRPKVVLAVCKDMGPYLGLFFFVRDHQHGWHQVEDDNPKVQTALKKVFIFEQLRSTEL